MPVKFGSAPQPKRVPRELLSQKRLFLAQVPVPNQNLLPGRQSTALLDTSGRASHFSNHPAQLRVCQLSPLAPFFPRDDHHPPFGDLALLDESRGPRSTPVQIAALMPSPGSRVTKTTRQEADHKKGFGTGNCAQNRCFWRSSSLGTL